MSAIISALKRALEADPANWETRLALTEAYVQDGKAGEATALLKEAEGLPGDDADARIAAARCHALVESPGARGILEPVFAANPGNARAHLALAFIAHREGDAATATRHFITATSLDPALHESDPELARVYGSVIPRNRGAAAEAPESASREPEKAAASGRAESIVPDDDVVEVSLVEEEREAVAGQPLVITESDTVSDAPERREENAVAEAGAPSPESYLPEPGHFPLQKLEEAVAEAKIRPLVDPRALPKTPRLIVEEESPGAGLRVTARIPAADLTNVYVEPHAHERKLYDYRHRDDSIFEPAHGPDSIYVGARKTEDGKHVATPEESLRVHQEECARSQRRTARRDKLGSVTIAVLIHAVVFLVLGLIVISTPRKLPPQIVAIAAPTAPVDVLEKKKVERPTQKPKAASSAVTPDLISSFDASNVFVSKRDDLPVMDQALLGSGFSASLNFGATGAEGQNMLFGEPIDGTKLGVILDVSGSMAEYLPKVIREIDRNFDKAAIVYVNNAMLRDGTGTTTEVRPIIAEEVVRVSNGHITPYWFLWGDLPRKADQKAVDRLIEIFKTRPDSYLAVGGNNRIAGAIDFLSTLGIDALYVFSDFKDHVDEDAAVENARKLTRAGVKVYVQPARDQTEFLEVMSRKIAARTHGRELRPLIALDSPEDLSPEPLLAEVMSPVPIKVEGVNFGTVRPDRYGSEFYDFRSPGSQYEVIEVFENENFDLVLYGPEARAEIFLKTKEGYVGLPVSFRYHSRKWLTDDKGDLYWRQRKWLRNQEPPLLEGNEITWKMVLEDEITFDVWFVFEGNTFMATYAAEIAPDERGDDASIDFHVPPLARERNDIYYSRDFPQGLTLKQLRDAVAPNHAVFNLSTREADRYAASWGLYGYQRGLNERAYNVLCRTLPQGILNAKVEGQSFGPRVLTVALKQNDILLRGASYRSDIELWEGFSFRLTRPRDRTRHRLTKTKAFELTIE